MSAMGPEIGAKFLQNARFRTHPPERSCSEARPSGRFLQNIFALKRRPSEEPAFRKAKKKQGAYLSAAAWAVRRRAMWRAPLRGHARQMARCGPGCTYSALSHTGRLCKVVPPAATPRRTHITRARSLRIGGKYGGAKKGGLKMGIVAPPGLPPPPSPTRS